VVDVFNEVDERVRSDRFAGLAQKSLPWVLALCGLAVVAALGVWGFAAYRQHAGDQASQAYSEGERLLGQGDSRGALVKFDAAAQAGSPIYKTLALMQEAGLRVTAGDNGQAVQLLDTAASSAPNQTLADAARLKAAWLLLDAASPADLETRLAPLADIKRPFHVLAREAIAMVKLRAGKFADARSDFSVLMTSLDASDEVRQRARGAITLIDNGMAPDVAPTVAAALKLPAPPPLPADAQTSPAGAAQ
jgi:hypothetical protein